MIRWILVSLIGILSGGLVISFILKNYLGVKYKFWWLNDTLDGDFGADWWLKEKGLKKGIWSAISWFGRNHSWNYISQFKPHWNAGKIDEFLVIENTINCILSRNRITKWTRADKEKKIYGKNYIAYRIDGKTYCQWSYACKWFHIQLGAGGSEYRFRIKL
jgi:hypothetical protein